MPDVRGAAGWIRRAVLVPVLLLATLLVATCDGGTQPVLVANVDVTAPAQTLAVYRTLQLAVALHDATGNTLSDRPVSWSSSSDAVATVSSSGLVTGISAGPVTITATSQGTIGNLHLDVAPAAVVTVRLTPDTATISQGESRTPAVTLEDERGVVLADRTIVWTSGSPAVADVSAGGVVTGVSAGVASITATAEGKSATMTVTVRDSVAAVAITPDTVTLDQGMTRGLTVTVTNGGGATLSGRPVTWSTSNAAVATVSVNGVVRALAAGTAIISGTVEGKSGVATVTVRDSIASVAVIPSAPTLVQGDTTTLHVDVRNAAGAPLTGRTVAWTTNNLAVATVSPTGLVSTGSTGTATITATVDGKSGTALVTITSGGGPAISAITPATLVPGATATISGSRFSMALADNVVTIGGASAVVTAASTTELQVTVPCVPSGTVPVVVTVAGASSSAYSHALQVTSRHTLAVGQSAVVTDGARVACNEVAATGVQSRYVLAVYNTTASPTVATDYQLSGGTTTAAGSDVAFDAVVAPPHTVKRRAQFSRPAARAPFGDAAHDEVHHRLLEKNRDAYRQLFQRYGRTTRRSGAVGADAWQLTAGPPPLTRTIRVSNINASNICTSYFTINATRVYYAGKLAIYEDDATPDSLKAANNAAMASYYQQIGDQYNADMEPIVRANFGDPLRRDAETDNDGVLIAVFTPVVNKQFPNVAGFVVGCDQYPNGTGNTASNHGEYFYAYQPTTVGTSYFGALTPNGWYYRIRSTFIHETKHVASFAARVANNSPVWEESWLEEGTARHSEELWARASIYNVAWKGNTGYGSSANPTSIYCDVRPGTSACDNSNPRRPALAAWRHFAPLYDFLGNSSMLSPFGRTSIDDAGYFYAISWSLVRYAIDRYATTESSFLTGLTQATAQGTANLTGRSGVSTEELLGRWALALYADDLAGIGANTELQIPTWNAPSMYAGLKVDYPTVYTRATPLVAVPLTFGTIAPTNYTGIVGGGIDYFELSGVQASAQVIRVQSTAGGNPPSTLRFAILRVQ